MSERTPIVDLSLDFDFFSRELLDWDWGHGEGGDLGPMFGASLWPIRYGSLGAKIYDETSIETHADFTPEKLTEALEAKGLIMDGPHTAFRRVGIADSHRHAYRFFLDAWGQKHVPDGLIQLDAHHDCWAKPKGQPIHCGNWLTALIEKRPKLAAIQVYPTWKDPDIDGPPEAPMIVKKWNGFRSGGSYVRHIFLCRSAAWLPPHHDERFVALARALGATAGHSYQVMESITDRKPYILSRDEAQAERDKTDAYVAQWQKEAQEKKASEAAAT